MIHGESEILANLSKCVAFCLASSLRTQLPKYLQYTEALGFFGAHGACEVCICFPGYLY